MRILLLNGPNLNLLGTRRPEVYGATTIGELESMFRAWADDLGVTDVAAFQSNHEGDLIDRIHDARGSVDGIVFNPGAYTHTSYALHDAIESVEIPTVEVHISNVEEREAWRRVSHIRPACVHTIYGRGIEGYRWALRHLIHRAAMPVRTLEYGPGPDRCADLRVPGSTPAPLLVLVHGGFWRHMWTRDTTEAIAIDATRRGLATFNVEYRRVGSGGGGSASVEDVVAAIRSGLEHPDVDATRWALAGHSAGGQLALVAANRMANKMANKMDGAPGAPRVVVTMGGVADLEQAIAEDLGDGAVAAYLGSEDAADLSPVRVMPIEGHVVIAHGALDDRVPVGHAHALSRVVGSVGSAPPSVLIASDGGHFDYLDPRSAAWKEIAELLVAELER